MLKESTNTNLFWEQGRESFCFQSGKYLGKKKKKKMEIPVWQSRLRILHCHSVGAGHNCGGGSTPGPGTCTCSKKNPKKQKAKKERERIAGNGECACVCFVYMCALPFLRKVDTWSFKLIFSARVLRFLAEMFNYYPIRAERQGLGCSLYLEEPWRGWNLEWQWPTAKYPIQ